MRALGGSWAALAAEFGGSHLVMKCFDFAVRSAMRFSILAVRFCRLPTFSVSRGDRTRRLPWRITEPNLGTNYANHAHHEAQIVITSLQGVADKEAIVQELVGARRTLYASPRGTAVRLFSGSLYLPSLSPCICLLWVPVSAFSYRPPALDAQLGVRLPRSMLKADRDLYARPCSIPAC